MGHNDPKENFMNYDFNMLLITINQLRDVNGFSGKVVKPLIFNVTSTSFNMIDKNNNSIIFMDCGDYCRILVGDKTIETREIYNIYFSVLDDESTFHIVLESFDKGMITETFEIQATDVCNCGDEYNELISSLVRCNIKFIAEYSIGWVRFGCLRVSINNDNSLDKVLYKGKDNFNLVINDIHKILINPDYEHKASIKIIGEYDTTLSYFID